MMVQSSRKNMLINKEEIINYQFQILQQSTPLAKPTISNSNKYALWDLEAKIKEAVGEHNYSVRWIGNSQTAYLETYAYIMLIAASHSEANIIQFKHVIYKLGRECLNLPEQKLLVEFLCLIEYSRDRYAFLNKYPQIQTLLIKILHYVYVEEESPPAQDSSQEIKKKAKVRRKTSGKRLSKQMQKKQQSNNATYRSKNSESQQAEYEKELQQIYSGFNKHFNFISILGSNEYSCSLRLFQTKKIFVIIEKDCYFMVEMVEKTQKTFLQFTLGNKYLHQNIKEQIQEEIRAQITAFDQKPYFNREELDAIMEYQSQVQQSTVIPIQRASQIRSPMNNRFGFTDSKRLEYIHITSEHKNSHTRTIGDRSSVQIDKTFIDQLITNPALNTEKEVNKFPLTVNQFRLPGHLAAKKQNIMQKMKEFKKMKEAIQSVRERIQGKLKKIDEVQNFKTEPTPKNLQNKESQKAETQKSIVYKKDQQFNQLFSQPSIKFKLDSPANRTDNFNVPTSLHSLPEGRNLKELIIDHKSQYKIPQDLTNSKYLSQKAQSRPQSKIKSTQKPIKLFQRKSSPIVKQAVGSNIGNRKGSMDVGFIHPLSPNNVNVNVNVSINENMLNPRYTAPTSSFLKHHLQKYATSNQNNHNSQQLLPSTQKWAQNSPTYYNFSNINQQAQAKVINSPWNVSRPNSVITRH